MGDERTNDVFFDDVFVHDDYVVGELNHGFQYISEALDLERFTMFTFSPIEQRLDLLCDYVANGTRDGKPLKDDPVIRRQIVHGDRCALLGRNPRKPLSEPEADTFAERLGSKPTVVGEH